MDAEERANRMEGAAIRKSAPTASDGVRTEPVISQPHIDGYEILHEVGRGGVGVVYKARQNMLVPSTTDAMVLTSSSLAA